MTAQATPAARTGGLPHRRPTVAGTEFCTVLDVPLAVVIIVLIT